MELKKRCYLIIGISFCLIAMIISSIIIAIVVSTTVNIPSNVSVRIGDILNDSSALFIFNTSVYLISVESLHSPVTVYKTPDIPSTITDYLPSKLVSDHIPSFDHNYLGTGQPLYLLPDSVIHFNTSVTIPDTEELPLSDYGCFYLFNNSDKSDNYQSGSYCLPPVETTPTYITTFFYITEESQYYVEFYQMNENINISTNSSVIRVLYNTTGLASQVCQNCSIDTDICNSDGECYALIQPNLIDEVSVIYFMSVLFLSLIVLIPIVIIFQLIIIIIVIIIIIELKFKKQKLSTTENKNYSEFEFFNPISLPASPDLCSEKVSITRNRSTSSNLGIEDLPMNRSNLSSEDLLMNRSNLSSEDLLMNQPDLGIEEGLPMNRPISFNLGQHLTTNVKAMTFENSAKLHLVRSPYRNFCFSSTESISTFSHDSSETSDTPLLNKDSSMTQSTSNLSRHLTTNMEDLLRTRSASSSISTRHNDLINEKNIEMVRDIFNLMELTVDSSGMVYHCKEYGVTLVIPEGAVSQPTTVWYGARLLSHKFQFQEDYVPVSPIVWVHTSRELIKPAELYIPHHVNITDMSQSDIEFDLFLLTAEDDKFMAQGDFIFDINTTAQMAVDHFVVKVVTSHFCSNCIATHGRSYRSIPKSYLLAKAEKTEPNGTKFVKFYTIYNSRSCQKMIEQQCSSSGYTKPSYSQSAVKLTEDKKVSLSFDKSTIKGWNIYYDGFDYEYISEESIDYYQMMGCEDGIVTEENLDNLKSLEKLFQYPPHIKIYCIRDGNYHGTDQVLVVNFNNVDPSPNCNILLEGTHKSSNSPLPLSLSPPSSNSLSFPNNLSKDNDPFVGKIINILSTKKEIMEKFWFDFGFNLGLSYGQLSQLGTIYRGSSVHMYVHVIFYWRGINPDATWELIAEALYKIDQLTDLADEIKKHFIPCQEQTQTSNGQGIYCKLCNEYHLISLQEGDRERNIFIKNYPEFTELMSDVTNRYKAAASLMSAELISRQCYDDVTDSSPKSDREKGEMLCKALMSTIEKKPNLLTKLIEVLREIDAFQTLVAKF